MNPVLRSIPSCVGLTAVALLASSCNFFSPVGGPGGDTQLLSAARACLDRGDYQCASDNYQKLSANDADIANSEGAYTILDQQNAGMSGFSQFLGNLSGNSGTIGTAVTQYANRLGSVGTPGEASRVAILGAYQKAASITDNAQLQNFVQFTSGLALVAELLAEASTTPGSLSVGDISTNPTTCKNATAITCSTSCAAPATSSLVNGTGAAMSDSTTSTNWTSTNPNTGQLAAAISAAASAVSALSPGGGFGNIVTVFNTVGGQSGNCVRWALLQQGFGN